MDLIQSSDDPGFCPMCDRDQSLTVDGVTGVNATVCRACSENLHLRTPGITHVHGETTSFDVYVYSPGGHVDWPLDSDPVFITGSKTGARVDDHADTVTYDDLSNTEKQFVTTLANGDELDTISGVERVPVRDDWEPVIRSIHPLHSTTPHNELDDDVVTTVASRIPELTAIYLHTCYTTRPDELRQEIERSLATDTAQDTLFS